MPYFLFNDESESFYKLGNDPLETKNLLNKNWLPLSTENEIIYEELVEQLAVIKN